MKGKKYQGDLTTEPGPKRHSSKKKKPKRVKGKEAREDAAKLMPNGPEDISQKKNSNITQKKRSRKKPAKKRRGGRVGRSAGTDCNIPKVQKTKRGKLQQVEKDTAKIYYENAWREETKDGQKEERIPKKKKWGKNRKKETMAGKVENKGPPMPISLKTTTERRWGLFGKKMAAMGGKKKLTSPNYSRQMLKTDSSLTLSQKC